MNTATLPPLTAEEFNVQYDADHTFPFWEDEGGDSYCGYGHPEKSWVVARLLTYFLHVDPAARTDDYEVEESDVQYKWAVTIEFYGEPGVGFVDAEEKPVTEATSGAFPVWTVSL